MDSVPLFERNGYPIHFTLSDIWDIYRSGAGQTNMGFGKKYVVKDMP